MHPNMLRKLSNAPAHTGELTTLPRPWGPGPPERPDGPGRAKGSLESPLLKL